jgi:hypothetical protein
MPDGQFIQDVKTVLPVNSLITAYSVLTVQTVSNSHYGDAGIRVQTERSY